MVGEGGLADLQLLQQRTGADLSGLQQFQDPYPVGVAQRLKDPRGLRIGRVHLLTSLSDSLWNQYTG